MVSPVGEVVQADTEFVAAFFIDAHRERRKQSLLSITRGTSYRLGARMSTQTGEEIDE